MENNCEPTFISSPSRENNFCAVHDPCDLRRTDLQSGYRETLLPRKYAVFRIFLIITYTLITYHQSYSQVDMDYAIHANIVYRFTKYIDWPHSKKNGDFVIGIVGDSPLFEELKQFIADKKVGSQKIVIKKYSPALTSYNCHILFITEEKSNSLKKIAEKTKGTSTLLVSESDGLARKGSCINFIVIEDHLKLEINKKNIEQRDLSIATELLSLGIIVK